jgi:hypothetical protein
MVENTNAGWMIDINECRELNQLPAESYRTHSFILIIPSLSFSFSSVSSHSLPILITPDPHPHQSTIYPSRILQPQLFILHKSHPRRSPRLVHIPHPTRLSAYIQLPLIAYTFRLLSSAACPHYEHHTKPMHLLPSSSPTLKTNIGAVTVMEPSPNL